MGFAIGLGKSVGEQVKNALELPFVIIDGVCIKLSLSLIQGIVNLIEDPQGTFEGTVSSVEGIVDKIKAIPTYIEQAPAAFQARLDEISAIEDPYKKGEALGTLVGDVLPAGVATSAFVGKTVKTVRGFNAVKKGAAKAAKGAKVEGVKNVTQVAKAAEQVSKIIQLTNSELQRIQNAANRIGKPIHVVGSRVQGTAKVTSDFDYVIEGISSNQRDKIRNSLPGAPSRIDNLPGRIDLFRGPVDDTKPYITIYPK